MRWTFPVVLWGLMGCKGAEGDPAVAKAQPESSPAEPKPPSPLTADPQFRGRPELRPIPGTDWERSVDLVGKVRKVTTTRSMTFADGKSGKELEITEFTERGHLRAISYDDGPYMTSELDAAGNVVMRKSKPVTALGITTSPSTKENLAFDSNHRVLQRRFTDHGEQPHVETTTFEYDDAGRVIKKSWVGKIGPGAPKTTTTVITYDEDGDWETENEGGTIKIREVIAYDGRTKTVRFRDPYGGVTTQVIDRPTGRVLSEKDDSITLARTYGPDDDHGNWLEMTNVLTLASGERSETRIVRTLEYFD